MTPRTRIGAVAFPVAIVAAGLAWWAVMHDALLPAPEAVARGRSFVRARCLHCHAVIPLGVRVQGWSVERAYDALGRLPQLQPAMSPFPGTDAERRFVAEYLSALGAGEAPPP